MATPLGHSIVGLATGRMAGDVGRRSPWRWYAFAVIAANAADFDFIPGLLAGDANRFHQLASHSILAAVVFGLLTGLVVRGRVAKPVGLGFAAGLVYATHLLLDCLTFDGRPPVGIPLLWPFSDETFIAPVTVFNGVMHGVPGEGLGAVLGQIFSLHNLGVLALETAILMPLAALVWYLARARA
jgi:inner membrane protein